MREADSEIFVEKNLHVSGPTQFKLCCLKVNCISNIRNENSIPHEYVRPTHFSIYKHGHTKPICPSQVNLVIRTDAGIWYCLIDYVLSLNSFKPIWE